MNLYALAGLFVFLFIVTSILYNVLEDTLINNKYLNLSDSYPNIALCLSISVIVNFLGAVITIIIILINLI